VTAEIEQLTAALRRAYPDIVIEERGASPGVEHGWCIRHPRGFTEVQVESTTGNAPFFVESELAPPVVAPSVSAAVTLVVQRLGLQLG
jgi:hypothetical protein